MMRARHDTTGPGLDTRCKPDPPSAAVGSIDEHVHDNLGSGDMTNQRTKGTISKTQGKIEEVFGKLTGDRREEAKGKIRQVLGDAQRGLGEVQDAVRKDQGKTPTR
jgi:uncharacterized protein YjbJ (UPF0337 family)